MFTFKSNNQNEGLEMNSFNDLKIPSSKECLYTSCYCEENVWKLCEYVKNNQSNLLSNCYAVFISNKNQSVPLWYQKSGKDENKLAVWDYHVIFIYHSNDDKGALVYDLDTVLPFPVPLEKYAPLTFQFETYLQPNHHRWNWIERRDGNGDTIGTWCKKINVAGQAYCVFCNSLLKYGGEGFKAFTNHSKTVMHIKYSKCIRHSMTLSNYANSKNTDDLLETDARPLDIVTRKAHQEVLITSFIAENSLSFNVAPNLIELCKQLSRDQTALNSLEMSRTTACYKMKYGLAKTIKENFIKTLKETPFPLNLDESTSNAQESILAILVQFYDNNQNEVVVHHFASLKMESCNSEAVFKAVVNTIEDNNIPWTNLISVLMDSCNTMRGKKRVFVSNNFDYKILRAASTQCSALEEEIQT
ncbi:protein N-terminal glutamine amidohydrolase [Trichonephila clavipes]|nr:protein N-terminal glutamine amidohydrolase [Trichonephila clavipes]